MGSKSYKEYLERYQDNFSPAVYLFVYYPIIVQSGKVTVEYDRYFADLEAFSLLRRYTSAPFWAYINCQGYKTSSREVPAPKLEYIRFNVFSALAYGAQGLFYWTYRQIPDTSAEKFYNAPVGTNGVRTNTWNYVQQINAEVTALAPVFSGAELIQCKHTGSIQYSGTQMMVDPVGPLMSISSNSTKGVLVSWLFNNYSSAYISSDYLVIVNHDVEQSQTLKLTFSSFWTVSEIQVGINPSRLLFKKITSNEISRIIEPGGYLLFTWK